jgi:hypothetical protein
VLVVLLAVAAVLGGASAAAAIDIPNPIGDAILNKICPSRQAPYPASPNGPVVARGGGAGLYANYDYAGLEWTTWDAGCLSWNKADTSIGSELNVAANSVDQLVNEVQIAALDDKTTASFDGVVERALVGLRDAFWNPWSMTGLAVVGLLVLSYLIAGRASDIVLLVGGALLVVALLSTLMLRPHLPAQAGNAMTSGVAQGISQSLIAVTPGGDMPASATPEQKFGEGFYQVSYRAWLEGWSCGDMAAEARYGHRLLNDQAFSVAELRRVEADPAAAQALVDAKQADWGRIGNEMPKTDPVAFGCWKGDGQSRTASAIKHGVVTMSAGFWVLLGSVALLALKWVLRLALLFFVTFSALMVFSARVRDRMTEFLLLGLVGPPFVAAGVGTLLWGYYAILLDRSQAWWQSGVSAFALGLAVWFGKGVVGRLFVGLHEVGGRSTRMVTKTGKRVHRMGPVFAETAPSGHGAAAGALAGTVAGTVVAQAVNRAHGADDEARRDGETLYHADTAAQAHVEDNQREVEDMSDQNPVTVEQAAAGDDAPARALERIRALRAPDVEPPGAKRYGEDLPVVDPYDPSRRDTYANGDDRRDDLEVET